MKTKLSLTFTYMCNHPSYWFHVLRKVEINFNKNKWLRNGFYFHQLIIDSFDWIDMKMIFWLTESSCTESKTRHSANPSDLTKKIRSTENLQANWRCFHTFLFHHLIEDYIRYFQYNSMQLGAIPQINLVITSGTSKVITLDEMLIYVLL